MNGWRTPIPRLALAAVLIAAIAWASQNRASLDLGALEAQIRGLGEWAPAGFVLLFALATVLFVPGSLFGLAGGLLFTRSASRASSSPTTC